MKRIISGSSGGTVSDLEDYASSVSLSSPLYFLSAPNRCERIMPRIIARVEKQI